MNIKALTSLICVMLSYSTAIVAVEDANISAPKAAFEKLMSGNQRYIDEVLKHPNRSQEHRETLSGGQSPFAIILGCSDSRVSPIIIFDQGIGDLFEVRVAGNVAGPIEIASVEFAATTYGSALIFVLGHENCGAVKAVLAHQTKDIEPIAVNIESAIKQSPNGFKSNLEEAIKANVQGVIKQLRQNPAIAKLIDEKKLEVVGGYYQLSSGKVELCCERL